MIEIKAIARREFLFPAVFPLALQFFSDFRRVTQFLPHISLIKAAPEDDKRFRVLYSTTELGAYQVHIFADVETEIVKSEQTLYVRSVRDTMPVKSKATLRSLTAPGQYSSRSVFREAGNQCEVLFIMELSAVLPRPLGLRFIPGSVLTRIADSITNQRMDEIIEGFITKSISAFAKWEQLKDS